MPGELARLSPPAVSNPSDNLKNLFEIPVLFYALSLYLFATGQVDGAYVAAGWVFVAFRALHSAMHCTSNVVMVRFYLYLISTLAVWFMLVRAAIQTSASARSARRSCASRSAPPGSHRAARSRPAARSVAARSFPG